METLEPRPRSEWAKFLVPLLFLAVMAGALGTLLVVILTHFDQVAVTAPPQTAKAGRQGMIRLALICAALLGLTLIVLFWMIVRFAGSRLRKPIDRSATGYVDAWSLAGQRVKLPDDGPPEEPDVPEPEDPEESSE